MTVADSENLANSETIDKVENAPPPRGVAPSILIAQVKNTVPFIFSGPASRQDYLHLLRYWPERLETGATHAEYYHLCLAAHHATVASFVPTDVDNQIRFRLWHPTLSAETTLEMAKTVADSHEWNWRPVSRRELVSPISGEILSGHHGEWFSTAIGAYGGLRRKNSEGAASIAAAIVREVRRHARIIEDFVKLKDGISILKAATLIAHNLGDLWRVVEMWTLPKEDPLIQTLEVETAHPTLVAAGNLNKTHMANENHRHFSLRSPKCLRTASDLLLPIGPFFDDWGMTVATHAKLTLEEKGEIIEALIDGWQRLKIPTVGYARALSGIEESFPGGLSHACQYLPARIAKAWKTGVLRQLCAVPRRRFEEQWKAAGLKIL